ncbi:hypothetical protein [Paenibacillus sp. J2TS4]|uniref:hypothetical protein n=1 Tax=Paenibacillus sp. J2TS4 TaxID=2807194 RepID=UPI001B0CC767|nr:hypothetical protein [Paenibacillus sp. J2TS4]GIP31204.1 hypothetical protein J2TS4_04140 [Paenibacillus sp. J2TS4]
MENNKKYNLIIIGLIGLVALMIYQNVKFKKEMEFLNSHVSNMELNLNNGMNNLSYTILNQVENLINEQQNMVSEYKSTYNSVDAQKGIVKSLVEFSLKQSDADSKVYLNVSTQNNPNGLDFECGSANGFSYACETELSYKDNYILNIYQKDPAGSYKKLNSDSYPHHIKSDFENRINLTESGTSTNNERTDYSFKLRNKTFGEQSFEINSVIVKAFYEGREVYSKDVTSYNIVNSEARDKMNVMIASGQIDSTAIPEIEYSEISTDDNGDEYGNYMVSILHADTGAPVENIKYPEYSFKVMITLHNGDVYEY